MYYLTLKVYKRHYDGDERYTIETVYSSEENLKKWFKRCDGWFVELLSWGKCKQ